MGRLDGKIALISGAARGQGEAEARLFAAEGARVVVGDVLDDHAAVVATDLGDRAIAVHLDVRKEDEWAAAVDAAERAFGPVDVLVNNAGILHFSLLRDTSLDDYMNVIEVNQVGCFLGMRAVVPSMTRAGGGSIVNISSTGGLASRPGTLAYGASKWAIRGMTKTAALELGRLGIRVNSVHPGPIETEMTRVAREEREAAGAGEPIWPLRRWGQPAEIARLALFLASDESSYSTGGEFVADGGMLAGPLV